MKNYLKPMVATVVNIRDETSDTRTYTLRLMDRRRFSFKPGQFNLIGIPGVGEAPISISSEPNGGDSFDHTIRAVGAVTNAVAQLREGDMVHVRGPYGSGWPMREADGSSLLVIAGGIGLAPLRPFILHVFRQRKRFGKVVVLYGARTPGDLLYRDELPAWRKQRDTEILLTVDEVPEGVKWAENRGVVTKLFDLMDIPLDALVLTCGPEIMMRFVVIGLLQRGFSSSRIYLSLERRMKCGVAQCGHCQVAGKYVCRDGPVFPYLDVKGLPDTMF